jgi:hypothetical protein
MRRLQGGIYLFRTNKPQAILGVPIIGRHNGYVGQSNAYRLRWSQHTAGGGKFKSTAKPWSDLDPEPWRILPLPAWTFLRAPWLVDALEALCIFLLAPVYNDKLNKWNLRRISLKKQASQRRFREDAPAWLRISLCFIVAGFKFSLLALLLLVLRKAGLL